MNHLNRSRLDEMIKAETPTVDYSGFSTTSSISNVEPLSITDVRNAVKMLKKAEIKRQEWVNKLISDPHWQELNKKLMKLELYLFDLCENKKQDRWNDYKIAWVSWYSIQPNSMFPVHIDIKKRRDELLIELEEKDNGR